MTRNRTLGIFTLLAVALPNVLAGCAQEVSFVGGQAREEGQDTFESAALPGGGGPSRGAEDSAGTSQPSAPAANTARAVEETDLYRVEGSTLYYLNGYRGLMMFDISNITQPRFLGRMPIYGSPVEMIVRNGIATIVVADWYGSASDGSPFHGSVVRAVNAQNPAAPVLINEAPIGGWVRDTRVVGDVLYAVGEQYNYWYGYDAVGTASSAAGTTVASVTFGPNGVKAVEHKEYAGWSGVMNVTSNAIVLGHNNGYDGHSSAVTYLDISSPVGAIVERGTAIVNGNVQGWGQDNGRFNIDYQPTTHHARLVTQSYNNGSNATYLTTVDFTNASSPVQLASVALPSNGYTAAARFDGNRLYLSASNYDYNSAGAPIQIYDLSDDSRPSRASQIVVPGDISAFFPNGDRVFALGNQWQNNASSSALSLHYLDVTHAAQPSYLGAANFGTGWGWTPAASTFKAFAQNSAEGLVALPFSGWSDSSYTYSNGVQLIEYTADSIAAKGVAHTRGWVERGIFVGGKLISLSDQALSVIDYANHQAPVTVAELTLARNVVDARPSGDNITLLTTDWWANSQASELRTVAKAEAEDDVKAPLAALNLPGTNARLYRNGNLGYVVTTIRVPGCGYGQPDAPGCYHPAPHVTVVDFNGTPHVRGSIDLPATDDYYYGGYYGCYYYDWYGGEGEVLVDGSALAFRRMSYRYDSATNQATYDQNLYVVDLANPDVPTVASTVVNTDQNGWWGNMRVVGNTLMTTHFEWRSRGPNAPQTGRYYLDRIDLSNRAAPRVQSSVNVPGVLVGASETDPSLLYFVDYRWDSVRNQSTQDLDVARLSGNRAILLSTTPMVGYSGNVFVRGSHAYTTVERYNWMPDTNNEPRTALHDFDLSDPRHPKDRTSAEKTGWGWLLAVTGDRALVTSGWGSEGIDIYRLSGNAPAYETFVRTRGWSTQNVARDGNDLFLSSGYFGVQKVHLAP